MKLILLTHSRELNKSSNTGRLVQQCFTPCETVIWQRKQPDPSLLQLIASGHTALLYPSGESVECSSASHFDNYILIDSTWQEARKIYNHSPYLHDLPHVKITPARMSNYQLRRNQLEHGLCTVECAIELLRMHNRLDDAEKLLHGFQQLQQAAQ